MIRPFTFLCMLLAAGSGLYLYQTKHQAQMLDRDIARTMKITDATRQRAGLMRAEYALLNDPSRLAELSERLLPELKTTAPAQFSSWSDFERRLPAIGAPPPPPPLEPQAPDADPPKPAPVKIETAKAPPIAAPVPRPPAPAAATTPAVVAPAPAVVAPAVANSGNATQQASLAPRPVPQAPPPRPALAAAPPAALAAVQTGAPVPLHNTRSALALAINLPAAAPQTVTRPRTEPTPVTPVEVIARNVRSGPTDPSVPAVASALGMARTMAPAAAPISPVQSATGGMR